MLNITYKDLCSVSQTDLSRVQFHVWHRLTYHSLHGRLSPIPYPLSPTPFDACYAIPLPFFPSSLSPIPYPFRRLLRRLNLPILPSSLTNSLLLVQLHYSSQDTAKQIFQSSPMCRQLSNVTCNVLNLIVTVFPQFKALLKQKRKQSIETFKFWCFIIFIFLCLFPSTLSGPQIQTPQSFQFWISCICKRTITMEVKTGDKKPFCCL